MISHIYSYLPVSQLDSSDRTGTPSSRVRSTFLVYEAVRLRVGTLHLENWAKTSSYTLIDISETQEKRILPAITRTMFVNNTNNNFYWLEKKKQISSDHK